MSEAIPANEVVVLTAEQMSRTITRIAHEILEKNPGEGGLAVVGIHTRGAFLGERIRKLLSRSPAATTQPATSTSPSTATTSPRAALWESSHPRRTRWSDTDLPFIVDGARIVLVDDVLYTGRTIRAAVDALFDYGRPAAVQLAVLVDRGHRELPIRPDYVGKNLPTAPTERINVRVVECDGVDEVVLVRAKEA